MRCPHCKTFVTKIPVNWKCTRCGEKLPDPSKWFYFYEYMIEYLQNKEVIFWSIWFGIFLVIVAIPEMLLGRGLLFSYMHNGMLVSLIFIFFGGMLIELFVKINLALRLPYAADFILRERVVIRNIRKATNFAFIIGLAVCLYWLKPRMFFEYFPSYLIVIAWFMAFAWAVVGLFLDVRMVDDIRFRFYMDRLGITNLKQYRKIGTIAVAMLVVSAIGFHVLAAIPTLWDDFSDLALVGFIIHFVTEYMGWLF